MLFITGLLTVNSWSCSHTQGGSLEESHCLTSKHLDFYQIYLNTTAAIQVTFTIFIMLLVCSGAITEMNCTENNILSVNKLHTK